MSFESSLQTNTSAASESDRRDIARGLVASFEGSLSYAEGLARQDRAIAEASAELSALGTILGLEHRAVITLGKRGIVAEDLSVPREVLDSRGVELVMSSRGGQATLHSPGQLVIYPCVRLSALGVGVRDYVKGLEDATQSFFRGLGVETRSGCCGEPGLYTDQGKIAFFGIRVSRGIASHGISINLANDLELFQLIRSCGVAGEKFDRLANHGVSASSKDLFFDWIPHFLKTFA